jgi:ADP-ribosylglycohydrolase
MDRRCRYRGALLGLAAGDALGTTVEFSDPGDFEPLTDIVGGGPFRLKPGEWTDDTSMALCLAESLIICSGFDPIHQLETYVRWRRHGTGASKAIASTSALQRHAPSTSSSKRGNPIADQQIPTPRATAV